MRKLRIIPWVLGVGLIVTTIAGANHFLHKTEAPSGGGGAAVNAKPAAATGHDGLVAKGTVRSDPPIVAYTLPAHLQAGTIVEVAVTGGKKVEVGETLIKFDSELLKRDYDEANLAYATAFNEWKRAETEMAKLGTVREKAQLALNDAKLKRERANEGVATAKSAIDTYLAAYRNADNSPATPEQIAKYTKEDQRLFQANLLHDAAESAVKVADLDVRTVDQETAVLAAKAKVAEANAAAIKAKAAKAQQAIDDCTVKAKSAGVIEQVTASPGQTVYPGTRPPLFYLVPSGKRIVWAEIVPDFAHKIKDRVDQKVVISDDSNTHLIYEGVVKRISDSFLQKPNGQPDMINGKSNEVLIVEIEVVDATPAGKPPLRVGQPVRVSFK